VAKKKKVRVAFKKNRQKRTRANDLTSQYDQGQMARTEPAAAERVRAKGELSRRRTIIENVPDAADKAEHDASDASSVGPAHRT
jgi:ribosome biogenesis GTPase / thiamine phosphate phosphatase